MRVLIFPRCKITGQEPELFLAPESDRDRKTLERLLNEYEVSGMGRIPRTMEISHLQIRLQEKAK